MLLEFCLLHTFYVHRSPLSEALHVTPNEKVKRRRSGYRGGQATPLAYQSSDHEVLRPDDFLQHV